MHLHIMLHMLLLFYHFAHCTLRSFQCHTITSNPITPKRHHIGWYVVHLASTSNHGIAIPPYSFTSSCPTPSPQSHCAIPQRLGSIALRSVTSHHYHDTRSTRLLTFPFTTLESHCYFRLLHKHDMHHPHTLARSCSSSPSS